MSYETVTRTDVGRQREVNEDSVAVERGDGWTLLAVADGMGGHAAGDVASEAALEAFSEYVDENVGEEHPEELLDAGARAANDHLRELIFEDRSLEGMGTTLVGALLTDDGASLVNVGDSRAYHLTSESVEQVTVDQSLVQKLVEQGQITPEEAETHPQRNVVSQALGTEDSVDPDTYDQAVSGTLLLCSDGLPEEVPESAVHDIVRERDGLASAAEELIDRANENGGSDNITVGLARRE